MPVDSIQILRTQKDRSGKFGRVLGEFVLEQPISDLLGLKKIDTLNKLMINHHVAVEYHGQSKELIEEEHIKNRELVHKIWGMIEEEK